VYLGISRQCLVIELDIRRIQLLSHVIREGTAIDWCYVQRNYLGHIGLGAIWKDGR
jgi:hypothetical protein